MISIINQLTVHPVPEPGLNYHLYALKAVMPLLQLPRASENNHSSLSKTKVMRLEIDGIYRLVLVSCEGRDRET